MLQSLGCLTGTGVWPLSYVIHEDMVVPAAAGDLTQCLVIWFHHTSVYRMRLFSMLAMLVFTTSLTTSESMRSFVILSPSMRRLRFWIKGVVRAKDSQGARMDFRAHYLRASQLNGIAE